ncbi:hypothetical protein D9619_003258 [Psilocybe cf. subviscida]|uniref:Pentacotripeptide-repeat region of PRORP domain-containing protein n=1 Tax=Psilocybe cf. subviscida TaxID=2480587 RepID=A0A8H5AX20_9AGAR|nr:hypothetical protein D9619_003258 [Psilocybe cf. subviscida]
MLQRSCFAQKRHLERTSSICKSFAYRLALHSGSRLYATRPLPNTLSPTVQAFRLALSPAPPTNNATDDALSSVPPKLSGVLRAMAAGKPRNEILQSIEQSLDVLSLFKAHDQMGAIVLSLSKSPTPALALEMLRLASSLGLGLPSSVYEAVCPHLEATKQWNVLLDLIKTYEDHHKDTSVSFLNWRAKALLETRQYSRLKKILKHFEARHLLPTQKTFHFMLEGFLRNNDSEGAQQCINDIQKAGFPSTTTHALVARYHRQFNSNSDSRHNALKVFDRLGSHDRLSLANDLIQAALEARDLAGARALLFLFDSSSVADLASLISSQVNTEIPSSTTLLPKSLPLRQLIPDGHTFVKFMNHQIRNSDSPSALRLWKKASSNGIQPTEGVIVSLIHALFLTGRGDDAVKMISSRMDVIQSHKLAEFMDSHDDGPQSQLPSTTLTVRISNALLRGLLRRHGLACVPTLFKVMRANRIRPNEQTLGCILRHLKDTQATTPENLLQLLDDVSSSINPSQAYLHYLFSFVLRSHRRRPYSSAWSKARVPSDPRADCPVRIVDNFDPTAGLALKDTVPSRDGIQDVIQKLVDDGVKCDSPMMALRLLHDAVLCQDDQSAFSSFKVLLDRGLRISERHFGALVEGYASTGDFELASQAITTAEQFGITPNVFMYTSIISAYAKHREPASALQTFKTMIKSGIRPDVPAIDALVSAYFASGEPSTARLMLISLWPLIQPFPDVLKRASLSQLLTRFRGLNKSRR